MRMTEFESDGPLALIESARDAANELTSALAETALPHDALPGYRILREIHRGGQGVVYRAVRLATGRDVAVKVMRDGPFGGPRDISRFEREVRVLAQLSHPNIVGIHDRGSAAGCHFFAMDYVAGQALDAYIEEHRPSISERLELFLKICYAVNAAHLRGVIHRDLKPTNVRIDESGEPHVLDFGLAKVESGGAPGTSPRRTVTMTGQFIGSLPWASPEQACGAADRIDVRTDIYSLGVMLFHVLTQRFPYPVSGPMREVLTHIQESTPARPGSLHREIDADLDVIVLKALEKDPARRYQSAADLAGDIRRYLRHQPIAARPPSMVYQLRTFAKRNRTLVGGVVAVFIALLLGLAGTTWQAVRARDEAVRAAHEAETSKAIKEFLVQDLLASAKPEFAPGRKVTVEEVLANASARIEDAFRERPEIEASIRSTLGQVYMSLGKYPEAEAQLRTAVSLLSDTYGLTHLETLRLRNDWIRAGLWCGYAWKADEISAAYLRDCRDALGDDHILTLTAGIRRAEALTLLGSHADAVRVLGEALDRSRRVLGENHPLTFEAHNKWAQWTLRITARRAEFETMLRAALDRIRRALGDHHPETFQAMVNLGGVLSEQRRFSEAEPLLREGYDGLRRVLGETNPRLLFSMRNLTLFLREKDHVREAIALSRKALSIARSTVGDDNPITLETMQYVGTCLFRGGCFREAEELMRDFGQTYHRTQGDQSNTSAHALELYSFALLKLGRFEQAEEGFRRADLARLETDGASDAWCLRQLIQSLAAQDRTAEARSFGEKLLELRREPALLPHADAYTLNCYAYDLLTVEPEELRDPIEGLRIAKLAQERSSDEYHYNRFTLALAFEANGRLDEAIEAARRALVHAPLEHSTERAQYEATLARCLELNSDLEGAEQVYRDTLAARRTQSPSSDHDVAVSLFDLGNILRKHGKHAEAEPLLRECLETRLDLLAKPAEDTCTLTLGRDIARTMMTLGECLMEQKRYAEAEPLLLASQSTFDSLPDETDNLAQVALESIIKLYEAWGQEDKVAEWRAELQDR